MLEAVERQEEIVDILITQLNNKEGIIKLTKLQGILDHATLLDDTYRFDEDKRKCIIELERYYIDKPIKEVNFLFFFRRLLCGGKASILEVSPVIKIEESNEGYEDFEITLNKEGNILKVGTYKHTFVLSITSETSLRVYDSEANIRNPRNGYFCKKHQVELKDSIEKLSYSPKSQGAV